VTVNANPWVAALYDPVTALAESSVFAPHRRYLTNGLSGRVLDVGAGTGANVPYFRVAQDAARRHDSDLAVHLLEPNEHMLARARNRVSDSELDASIVAGDAQALPYRTNSFDAVISALVGCTIPDIDRALDEIGRVLRPGGEFRFFEHVAAPGALGRVQSIVDPAWTRVAGGCHLDRDLEGTYRDHPGLNVTSVERHTGVPPAAPFVRGVAKATD
jgi:ubiquinone/menaquinone biosynthesis C-methylase UbiE